MEAEYQGRVVFARDVEEVTRWLSDGLGLSVSEDNSSEDVSVMASTTQGDGRVEFYVHPAAGAVVEQHLGRFVSPNCDDQAATLTKLGCHLVQEAKYALGNA